MGRERANRGIDRCAASGRTTKAGAEQVAGWMVDQGWEAFIDYDMFALGGGVHCSCHELRRE
jgi:hypothetical protein